MGEVSDIKMIRDRIADDHSRVIFNGRLMYYLEKEPAYIGQMLEKLESFQGIRGKPLRQLATEDASRPVVLYGASVMGGEFYDRVLQMGRKPVGFCDKDPWKIGGTRCGLPVISPDELCSRYRDSAVVISVTTCVNEIYEGLLSIGFTEDQLYVPSYYEDQYFGVSFLRPLDDEIYVDVGAFNGQSINRFLNFSGGRYKRIYAMEPFREFFTETKRQIEGVRDIILINKGAWNAETTLHFNENGASSHITDKGTLSVEVMTIDSVLGDEGATLIKMDIESAELEALKGARETIARHKPRLAISVYHKPEDIVTIPRYILELNPDYKLYLRHHSETGDETVLYAL